MGKWITAKTSNLTRSRASGRPLAAPSGMYLAAAVLPTPQLGNAETAYGTPQHPYTEALLSSLPRAAGEERPRIRLTGEIPSHANPPSGCVFHTRCPR